MSAKTIDYLLEELKGSLQVADAQSLRIGAIRGVREVIRKIGIKKVCPFREQKLHIKNGYLELPKDFISVHDIFSGNENIRRSPEPGYRINSTLQIGNKFSYIETGQQLYFPNVTDSSIILVYYFIAEDEDGDIIIPDVIYNACFLYCEYDLLSKTNNTRHPKWQERRIMQMDSDNAINAARSYINESNNTSQRTLRNFK